MRFLAHRGYWTAGYPQNSIEAIVAASRKNHGVEIDLRDHDNEIVVAHDLPTGKMLTLEQLLASLEHLPQPLALNIKADGLAARVAEILEGARISDAYVFDMSVPDHLAWLQRGVPSLARWSDIEPHPVLALESDGIWLDSIWHDLWWHADDIARVLKSGKMLSIVSPELHGRPYEHVWRRIREADWTHHESVFICTDYPDLAESFFS